MKQCPRCNRNYADEALSYCLEDGTALVRKYDPNATLVNPNPPVAVIPPTVAYQEEPATMPGYMPAPGPAQSAAPTAPPGRSPWLVGLLVVLALGVGLTIGGLIFQRSSASSTTTEPMENGRDPIATKSTTPIPAESSPTPTPVADDATNPPPVDQQSQTKGPECVLYNNKNDKTVVNVRTNCDTRNCELDASTIAGEYPDNTAVSVVSGSNVQTGRFTWVKVIITASGRTVWVASTKIKCA